MTTRPTITVISLRDAPRSRAEHKTLCPSGFHKWQVKTDKRFDVKTGKPLTVERCCRCGERRTKFT